ncbi:hypothetical protein [Staphylococcus sp. GDY8P218P]|uniref:hypothetical protein n=1 Tax=Staphylococcus sp. GDY8P218P TaxID=2804178 RepID=UPI001AEBC434|nr:hypothetical protein [Staphylococcus sp. GDY8P218P]
MNYEQIREILKDNNTQEVVKAIFSFETGIRDEDYLDKMVDFFYEDDMPNFLDVQLHDMAEDYYYQQ